MGSNNSRNNGPQDCGDVIRDGDDPNQIGVSFKIVLADGTVNDSFKTHTKAIWAGNVTFDTWVNSFIATVAAHGVTVERETIQRATVTLGDGAELDILDRLDDLVSTQAPNFEGDGNVRDTTITVYL